MLYLIFRFRFIVFLAWTVAAFMSGVMIAATEKGCGPRTMSIVPTTPPSYGVPLHPGVSQ